MKLSVCFIWTLLLASVLATPVKADDKADVLAANKAFDTAVSNRNIDQLDPLWAHDSSVTIIHPSSKAPLVGWEAVRKSWAEGTLARFSELSVSMSEPDVRLNGNTAVAVGIEVVKGKRADSGAAVEFAALTTNIYEKRDGRWLMVHHHGSRLPQ
jgi:ketosteroid isomerase-like protein